MSARNSASSPSHSTEAVRLSCQNLLERMVRQTPSVVFACLGTVDGRSYAYASPVDTGSQQRTSAITCSLLALSESFSKESIRSNCSHVTVSTENGGSIIIVRVPNKARTYALSVGSDASDLLAIALRNALDAASELATIIDSAH